MKVFNMAKFKYLAVLLATLLPSIAFAATAVCTIEIEDINASVKNKTLEKTVVKETFKFKPGGEKQTKFFNLPDDRYICRLDFFDLNIGTSLSCEEKKDQGYSYMQSDQSGNKSKMNRNNLTFRDRNSHFVINAICK